MNILEFDNWCKLHKWTKNYLSKDFYPRIDNTYYVKKYNGIEISFIPNIDFIINDVKTEFVCLELATMKRFIIGVDKSFIEEPDYVEEKLLLKLKNK